MKGFLHKITHYCTNRFGKGREFNEIQGMVEAVVMPENAMSTASEQDGIPTPPKIGYVRLVSPFSQEMYADVPIGGFCEVEINTNGLENSNHFLMSLWNEMNILLHPQKCDYVPWFYRPVIVENGQNWKIIFLGDVHTSSGNFYLMLKMKDKSSIKSIMAYKTGMPLEDCKKLFEQLVSNAQKNINNLHTYSSTVRLKCKNHEITTINVYSGKNFYLYSDDKGICIDICFQAIDYIEAKQQLVKRLDDLCSFLTVETNLLFEVEGEVEIEENARTLSIAVDHEFIRPYIDGPSIREESLRLSEAGVKFLNQYIFVDRELVEDEVTMCFKRSCTHVLEGLQRQLEKGERIGFITKTQVFMLSPQDQLRSQNIITMAATSYLSALETASTPEGKPETCQTCGNVIYKISARVESMVSKYLNPETGREFKELYNLRSKFLHAGKLSCENYYITARPFIDPSTGSGLTDYGFISCRVNGKMMIVGIHNIQELTTYVLRCWYQDKLFGVTDFTLVEEHGNDIDPKQMIIDTIQAAMPKGVKVVDVTTI